MAQVTLKSESQIQSTMISSLLSALGISDINPGSVTDIFTAAAASSDFNLMVQIAQVSRLNDLNFLNRGDLDLKAFEYGLTRRDALKATGLISILRPTGFVKISTNFSSAQNNPIVGAGIIDVNDASNALFGSTGTLILGRGTNNQEIVTYSIAPANNISFWRFVLDAPLVNNHSTSETVILAQGGDEAILAGTLVRVLANGAQPELLFSIEDDQLLLTGEDRIDGVSVTAVEAGSSGNIPSNSISGTEAFPAPPFVGAIAQNSSKFTTGRDLETDDELRDRVRTAGDTLTRGVKQAILNAIVGLVDPDSAKRVVSASVVLPIDECGPVRVYIDDGLGFEPSFLAIGAEVIRGESTGGEERLQLDQFPVQKATVETTLAETFDFSTVGLTLILEVGILQETLTFNSSDFASPEIGTAEEVITAINDKSTLVEARTSQIGKNVTLTARVDTNESIRVVGGTANVILSFPTERVDTLNIYKDDVKLSKDGLSAVLDSQNISPFNLGLVGAFPHTLTLVVDGKTANPQTATMQVADVVDPNAVTVAEVASVLNRDIAGIETTSVVNNTRVRITSNLKLSSASKLQVTGGTMNDVTNGLNFQATEVGGVDGDFTFNRELGIIELNTPLTVNQNVSGGSAFTRAKLRALLSEPYVGGVGTTLVISVDGGADQTVTLDASFIAGNTAAVTATFINGQLSGALAVVRSVGSTNFVEIRTNSFATTGSIEVQPTSTANASGFQFPENIQINSDFPNTAFRVAGSPGPYLFAEGDILTIILDGNVLDSAFSITLSRPQTVTATTSATVFSDSNLNNVFTLVDEIQDHFVAFTAGLNTTTEGITTVVDQTGGIFRYTFSAVPTNFGDYVVGDLASITGMMDTENNGNFVIQAIGAQTIDVSNPNGVDAVLQAGSGILSQKRTVTSYNQLTGEITVGVGFTNVPIISDTFIILPSTVDSVVAYLQNIRVTPLSLKAIVEGVDNNTRIQISSLQPGSDGAVEIPPTIANEKFNFAATLFRGVASYRYYVGLLALTHKVLYGDDSDLTAFPGVAAAGITVQILAPTVREIRVELDVTLEDGISTAVLENEIRSVVSAYVNALGVGEDVLIERIRAAVIGVVGVVDVSISNPSANIAAADSEVIRVKDSSIVVG